MSEYMSHRMPDTISDRLPEMPDRLPEKGHNAVLPNNVLEYTSDAVVECQRKNISEIGCQIECSIKCQNICQNYVRIYVRIKSNTLWLFNIAMVYLEVRPFL